jgi:uncharacterized membrane protein YhaH (DUF805 family)
MHMHWREYLFSFHGRINRAKWWLFLLLSIVYTFVEFVLCIMLFGFTGILLGWLLALLVIWPSFAIGVKRLHDRGKSGWWLLFFYLVPGFLDGFNMATNPDMMSNEGMMASPMSLLLSLAAFAITIWMIVELGVLRGTVGDNKYGPDPLAHIPPKAA